MSIDLTPFDVVEVWGNPWHGKMTRSGTSPYDATATLLLDNETVKPGAMFPINANDTVDLSGAQLFVQFPDLPVPEDAECDIAIGATWKNWALLAGQQRQYSPFGGLRLGPVTIPSGKRNNGGGVWFYCSPDGTVWRLMIDVSSVVQALGTQLQATVYGWRTDAMDADPITIYSVPDGVAGFAQAGHNSGPLYTFVSASADGSRALTGRLSTIFIPSFNDLETPFTSEPTYMTLTVEGGSADVPPTITAEVLAGSESVMLPPREYLNKS